MHIFYDNSRVLDYAVWLILLGLFGLVEGIIYFFSPRWGLSMLSFLIYIFLCKDLFKKFMCIKFMLFSKIYYFQPSHLGKRQLSCWGLGMVVWLLKWLICMWRSNWWFMDTGVLWCSMNAKRGSKFCVSSRSHWGNYLFIVWHSFRTL